jgi:hypothetical protein
VRALQVLLLSIFLASAATSSTESDWASIRAKAVGYIDNVASIEDAPTDEAVKYLGSASLAKSQDRKVFPIEISKADNPNAEKTKDDGLRLTTLPSNALWPDRNGTIVLRSMNEGNAPAEINLRNPWEKRKTADVLGDESHFFCSGVIIGDSAAKAAILNGLIFREGDEIGTFRVTRIESIGVVLEGGGAQLVIPRGRRVTVKFKGT